MPQPGKRRWASAGAISNANSFDELHERSGAASATLEDTFLKLVAEEAA